MCMMQTVAFKRMLFIDISLWLSFLLVIMRLFGVRWKKCSHGFRSLFLFFHCMFQASLWFLFLFFFFRPVFVDYASAKMFMGTHARLMGTLSS